jgi:Tol biopolymer transport system component
LVSAPKPEQPPGKPPKEEPPADPAIAFDDGYWGSLKVMNEDGSNQATIIEEDIFDVWGKLSWSPDGGAIAWAGQMCGYGWGVWRIDVDVVDGVPQGSNLQQLVDESDCGRLAWCAAWSPLGDEIAFAVAEAASNNWFIKVVPAEGGPVEIIYESHEMAINLWSLTWSSDGTRIAFVATDGPEDPDPPRETYIAIIERETGTVTTLLKGEFQHVWIEWARGLDILLVSIESPAPTRIYTVDINNPTLVEIVEGEYPCWSPDNTKFVYYTHERKKTITAVYDLETGEIDKILNEGSRPDWRRCETAPP